MSTLAPISDKTQYQPCADECGVQAIRVELSERRRRSGDTVPVATCHLAMVESASSPVCKLARKLLHLGVDARTPFSIWRGRTKCSHDVPVGRWAELTVEESAGGTVHRRYRPSSGAVDASRGAKSDG